MNKPASPLFNLGFRVFFLSAGWFSLISMGLWSALYFGLWSLPMTAISPFQWHAHEMIYGYSVAVIAGFLLTAVKNWTGVQTLHGTSLMLLACLWLAARVCFSSGALVAAAGFDIIFLVVLSLAIIRPIVQVKQWRQLGVISKLVLLLLGNICFYLGAFKQIDNGIHIGIYGGLYLVIGLMLMLGRRVIPFFIERGAGVEVTVRNSQFIDISSLVVFVLFFVLELTQLHAMASAYAALVLCVLNGIRLIGWYTHAIWKKPLLWILYLSMWSICVGFALLFLAYYFNISAFIAVHALAYGGIGLMTLGMMARVALGHTGRNIQQPSPLMSIAFSLLALGLVSRVLLPMIWSNYYLVWIGAAQALWLAAFMLFLIVYTPILLKPRIDGKWG